MNTEINNKPLVSIIIPTFNRDKYLIDAIESALNQTYSNIEIVISNNASTDTTDSIICEYLKDKRIIYNKNPSNVGMVKNWNLALNKFAKGKYAIILADDEFFIDNNYIQDAVDLFILNDNLVLIFSDYCELYTSTQQSISIKYSLKQINNGSDMFYDFYSGKFPGISSGTCIFKRPLAISLKAFESDILSTDYELWLKLFLHGDVGYVNKMSLVSRHHNTNLSKTSNILQYFNNLLYISEIYQLSKEKGLDNKRINIWYKRMYDIHLSTILIRIIIDYNHTKDFSDYVKQLHKLMNVAQKNNINPLILLLKRNIFPRLLLSPILNDTQYSYLIAKLKNIFR